MTPDKDLEDIFLQPDAPSPRVPQPSEEEKTAADTPLEPFNINDLDSGRAMQLVVDKYIARIRQLKQGLSSSRKEQDSVIDEYLMQNLELINLNKNLEFMVKKRTRELEVTNVKLEVTNNNLSLANKLLEQQAHKLRELDQAKEALTHMIVHDMKNPLTAILGALGFFTNNKFNLEDEIHTLLLRANDNGKKLLGMMEEILMISRMESKEFKLKPSPADLCESIPAGIALMQQTLGTKKLQINFKSALSTLPLSIDVQIIERVLNNLLNNAIKYALEESEISVELEKNQSQVKVRVINWGPPIPEKHHHKIFEKFSRVKSEDTQFSGTGLGLAFCKMAVEAHGGNIGVISPVPPKANGTCFYFTLPLSPVDSKTTSPDTSA